MPTVLRERGCRIGFYSDEPEEPPHVHVKKSNSEAKFWIDPVRLSWSKGFREHDLREIERILNDNQLKLLEAWNNAD